MDIHVVPGDEVPIYRQIVRQVADAVAAGHLAPGTRLPSQRELAAQLVVAPLTVKKAYDLLEREGVLVTHHGKGSFVAEGAGQDDGPTRERLDQAVRQLVAQAWLAGLDERSLVALVRQAARDLAAQRRAAARTDEHPE